MDATRSMGLRLPVQGAVDRTTLQAAAAGGTAGGTGVDASQINWGQLGTTLLQNLPSIIGGIASLF
jgi:hypothetical protein